MNGSGARKWIVSFFALSLTVCLLLAGTAYLIDPFLQFRAKDHSYMLRGWFVDSGLIENYDYDTLIIGSSMVQNFDMDLFRKELGVKPLHIGMGAMNTKEIGELMNLAFDAGKARKYYICTDLYMFTTNAAESHYPPYLLQKDLLSRLRYLLSYEAWFRYIPVDTAFMALDALGVTLPLKYRYNRSIDRLEDWRLDFPVAGREAVLKNYVNKQYSVSDVKLENLWERMKTNIDRFLEGFEPGRGEYTFFFPPYSSLYWCNARNRGYFDVYLRARRYFTEQVALRGDAVYDFQGADCTADLDNYRDTTHYMPPVNDWMTKCFASGEYLVTPENERVLEDRLREITDRSMQEYAAILD